VAVRYDSDSNASRATNQSPGRSSARVASVAAHGVNGQFTYEISYDRENPVSSGLNVVYGDNGTGKSTFLHALFHLLSPGRQHAIALSRLQIDSITATLESGATISYESGPEDESPRLSFRFADAERIELPLEEYASERPVRESPLARQYQRAIVENTTPAILVSDDRSVSSSGLVDRPSRFSVESLSLSELRQLSASGELMSRMRAQEIEAAVDHATETLWQSAIRGMSLGGSNTQTLYVDLVRELESDRSMPTAAVARLRLEDALSRVSTIGGDYSKYGLVALDQVEAISKELRKLRANARSLPLIQRVVGPYISSLLVQMEALEESRAFIDAYVTAVNSFLTRKTFSYEVREGMRLTLDNSGTPIPLAALSSGEKHLLLLLSYAVVARASEAFFIIDEPELSLGLEWRRMLVPALLSCADPTKAQFLLASHAVEIVAEYEEQVSNPIDSTLDVRL